jgi:hypothetical protein
MEELDFMECANCGLRSLLTLIPLRWENNSGIMGFVLLCDKCLDDEVTINWEVDDGREEGQNQETD